MSASRSNRSRKSRTAAKCEPDPRLPGGTASRVARRSRPYEGVAIQSRESTLAS